MYTDNNIYTRVHTQQHIHTCVQLHIKIPPTPTPPPQRKPTHLAEVITCGKRMHPASSVGRHLELEPWWSEGVNESPVGVKTAHGARVADRRTGAAHHRTLVLQLFAARWLEGLSAHRLLCKRHSLQADIFHTDNQGNSFLQRGSHQVDRQENLQNYKHVWVTVTIHITHYMYYTGPERRD